MKTALKPSAPIICLGLSIALFLSNTVFAHAAESNFWKERSQSNFTSADKQIQLASLSLPQPGRINPVPSIVKNTLPKEIVATLPGHLAGMADILATIPAQLGTVRKVHAPEQGATGPVVLHIQDVHLNSEAQTRIAAVVRGLIDDKKTSLIALEGAFSELDFKPYHSFEFPEAVRLASDYLLKAHKISGPLHTAFNLPSKPYNVIGVDDRRAHGQNVDAYQQASKQAASIKNKLIQVERGLAEKKKAVFNANLLVFDQLVQQESRGTISLAMFLKNIQQFHPSGFYPNINMFDEASAIERSLDFKKVEQQRGLLIEKLAASLSAAEMNTLINISVEFRAGRIRHTEFYSTLKNLTDQHQIPLKKFPVMNQYIQYVLLSDAIDPEKLFQEITSLKNSITKNLAKTDAEIILARCSDHLLLIRKLLDFALTQDEWAQYQRGQKWLANLSTSVPLQDWQMINSDELHPFEHFYNMAEFRDKKMAENVISAIRQSPAQELDKKVIVLVTGGFHSKGIAKRLMNAGITTATFVPRLTKIESGEETSYLGIFNQEKTPLEKLVQGPKLYLSPNYSEEFKTAPPLVAGAAAAKKLIPPSSVPAMVALLSAGALVASQVKVSAGSVSMMVGANAIPTNAASSLVEHNSTLAQVVVETVNNNGVESLNVVQAALEPLFSMAADPFVLMLFLFVHVFTVFVVYIVLKPTLIKFYKAMVKKWNERTGKKNITPQQDKELKPAQEPSSTTKASQQEATQPKTATPSKPEGKFIAWFKASPLGSPGAFLLWTLLIVWSIFLWMNLPYGVEFLATFQNSLGQGFVEKFIAAAGTGVLGKLLLMTGTVAIPLSALPIMLLLFFNGFTKRVGTWIKTKDKTFHDAKGYDKAFLFFTYELPIAPLKTFWNFGFISSFHLAKIFIGRGSEIEKPNLSERFFIWLEQRGPPFKAIQVLLFPFLIVTSILERRLKIFILSATSHYVLVHIVSGLLAIFVPGGEESVLLINNIFSYNFLTHLVPSLMANPPTDAFRMALINLATPMGALSTLILAQVMLSYERMSFVARTETKDRGFFSRWTHAIFQGFLSFIPWSRPITNEKEAALLTQKKEKPAPIIWRAFKNAFALPHGMYLVNVEIAGLLGLAGMMGEEVKHYVEKVEGHGEEGTISVLSSADQIAKAMGFDPQQMQVWLKGTNGLTQEQILSFNQTLSHALKGDERALYQLRLIGERIRNSSDKNIISQILSEADRAQREQAIIRYEMDAFDRALMNRDAWGFADSNVKQSGMSASAQPQGLGAGAPPPPTPTVISESPTTPPNSAPALSSNSEDRQPSLTRGIPPFEFDGRTQGQALSQVQAGLPNTILSSNLERALSSLYEGDESLAWPIIKTEGIEYQTKSGHLNDIPKELQAGFNELGMIHRLHDPKTGILFEFVRRDAGHEFETVKTIINPKEIKKILSDKANVRYFRYPSPENPKGIRGDELSETELPLLENSKQGKIPFQTWVTLTLEDGSKLETQLFAGLNMINFQRLEKLAYLRDLQVHNEALVRSSSPKPLGFFNPLTGNYSELSFRDRDAVPVGYVVSKDDAGFAKEGSVRYFMRAQLERFVHKDDPTKKDALRLAIPNLLGNPDTGMGPVVRFYRFKEGVPDEVDIKNQQYDTGSPENEAPLIVLDHIVNGKYDPNNHDPLQWDEVRFGLNARTHELGDTLFGWAEHQRKVDDAKRFQYVLMGSIIINGAAIPLNSAGGWAGVDFAKLAFATWVLVTDRVRHGLTDEDIRKSLVNYMTMITKSKGRGDPTEKEIDDMFNMMKSDKEIDRIIKYDKKVEWTDRVYSLGHLASYLINRELRAPYYQQSFGYQVTGPTEGDDRGTDFTTIPLTIDQEVPFLAAVRSGFFTYYFGQELGVNVNFMSFLAQLTSSDWFKRNFNNSHEWAPGTASIYDKETKRLNTEFLNILVQGFPLMDIPKLFSLWGFIRTKDAYMTETKRARLFGFLPIPHLELFDAKDKSEADLQQLISLYRTVTAEGPHREYYRKSRFAELRDAATGNHYQARNKGYEYNAQRQFEEIELTKKYIWTRLYSGFSIRSLNHAGAGLLAEPNEKLENDPESRASQLSPIKIAELMRASTAKHGLIPSHFTDPDADEPFAQKSRSEDLANAAIMLDELGFKDDSTKILERLIDNQKMHAFVERGRKAAYVLFDSVNADANENWPVDRTESISGTSSFILALARHLTKAPPLEAERLLEKARQHMVRGQNKFMFETHNLRDYFLLDGDGREYRSLMGQFDNHLKDKKFETKQKFFDHLERLGEGLLKLRDKKDGFIRGKENGKFTDTVSTKDNIDAYSAFKTLYQLTGDKKYAEAALDILIWLNNNLYDHQNRRFYSGYRSLAGKVHYDWFDAELQAKAINQITPEVLNHAKNDKGLVLFSGNKTATYLLNSLEAAKIDQLGLYDFVDLEFAKKMGREPVAALAVSAQIAGAAKRIAEYQKRLGEEFLPYQKITSDLGERLNKFAVLKPNGLGYPLASKERAQMVPESSETTPPANVSIETGLQLFFAQRMNPYDLSDGIKGFKEMLGEIKPAPAPRTDELLPNKPQHHQGPQAVAELERFFSLFDKDGFSGPIGPDGEEEYPGRYKRVGVINNDVVVLIDTLKKGEKVEIKLFPGPSHIERDLELIKTDIDRATLRQAIKTEGGFTVIDIEGRFLAGQVGADKINNFLDKMNNGKGLESLPRQERIQIINNKWIIKTSHETTVENPDGTKETKIIPAFIIIDFPLDGFKRSYTDPLTGLPTTREFKAVTTKDPETGNITVKGIIETISNTREQTIINRNERGIETDSKTTSLDEKGQPQLLLRETKTLRVIDNGNPNDRLLIKQIIRHDNVNNALEIAAFGPYEEPIRVITENRIIKNHFDDRTGQILDSKVLDRKTKETLETSEFHFDEQTKQLTKTWTKWANFDQKKIINSGSDIFVAGIHTKTETGQGLDRIQTRILYDRGLRSGAETFRRNPDSKEFDIPSEHSLVSDRAALWHGNPATRMETKQFDPITGNITPLIKYFDSEGRLIGTYEEDKTTFNTFSNGRELPTRSQWTMKHMSRPAFTFVRDPDIPFQVSVFDKNNDLVRVDYFLENNPFGRIERSVIIAGDKMLINQPLSFINGSDVVSSSRLLDAKTGAIRQRVEFDGVANLTLNNSQDSSNRFAGFKVITPRLKPNMPPNDENSYDNSNSVLEYWDRGQLAARFYPPENESPDVPPKSRRAPGQLISMNIREQKESLQKTAEPIEIPLKAYGWTGNTNEELNEVARFEDVNVGISNESIDSLTLTRFNFKAERQNWNRETFEKAPRGYVNDAGIPQTLRLRNEVFGDTGAGNQKINLGESQAVYADDQIKPTSFEAALKKLKTPPPLDPLQELGRHRIKMRKDGTTYIAGDSIIMGFKTKEVVNSKGIEKELKSSRFIDLKQVIDVPVERAATIQNYYDNQGRRRIVEILQSIIVVDEHNYKLEENRWQEAHAVVHDPTPPGYDPKRVFSSYAGHIPSAIMESPDTSEVTTARADNRNNIRNYFSLIHHDYAFDIGFVRPTQLINTLSDLYITILRDREGLEWLTYRNLNTDKNVQEITFTPQVNGHAITFDPQQPLVFSYELENPELVQKAKQDALFFYFWARNKNNEEDKRIDQLAVEVYENGLPKLVEINGQMVPLILKMDTKDVDQSGFLSADYHNPLVMKDRNTDRQLHMTVMPKHGDLRVFPAQGDPRLFVIPTAWLKDRYNCDPSRLEFKIQPNSHPNLNSVLVSDIGTLRLPPAQTNSPPKAPVWEYSKNFQNRIYPKGQDNPGKPTPEPRVQIDEYKGTIAVFRGVGTKAEKNIYEMNVLTGSTYELRDGQKFNSVRVNYSPAISPFLRAPSYVESAFAGWLSRVINTIHFPGGQMEVNVANVDQVVSVVLRLYENGNKEPVVLYLPFGVYDPEAIFANLNANIAAGLIRINMDSLNRLIAWSGLQLKNNYTAPFSPDNPSAADPNKLPIVNRMSPNAVSELVDRSPLNSDQGGDPSLLYDWAQRQTNRLSREQRSQIREALTRELNDRIKKHADVWVPMGLWESNPNTHEEGFTSIKELGMALSFIAEENDRAPNGSQSLFEHVSDTLQKLTRQGQTRIVDYVETDNGHPKKMNYEANRPGPAQTMAGPNIAVAQGFLDRTRAEGTGLDYMMARRMTERVLEFIPKIDFLDTTESPEKLADRLVDQLESVLVKTNSNEEGERVISLSHIIPEVIRHIKQAHEQMLQPSFNPVSIRKSLLSGLTQISFQNATPIPLPLTDDDLAAIKKTISQVINISGGISEYFPIRTENIREIGVGLTPEPDNYSIDSQRRALKLFDSLIDQMNQFPPVTDSDKNFQRRVIVARANLVNFFNFVVLPHLERSPGTIQAEASNSDLKQGILPGIWRQQAWITGARTTGREGREQPYTIVPNKWPTLESSLAGIEFYLAIHPNSREVKTKVRTWLNNIMAEFGAITIINGVKVAGLDYTNGKDPRAQGRVMSAELLIRFAQIARQVDHNEAVNFAEKSISFSINNGSLVNETYGYDVTSPNISALYGIKLQEGRRAYQTRTNSGDLSQTASIYSTIQLLNYLDSLGPPDNSPSLFDRARNDANQKKLLSETALVAKISSWLNQWSPNTIIPISFNRFFLIPLLSAQLPLILGSLFVALLTSFIYRIVHEWKRQKNAAKSESSINNNDEEIRELNKKISKVRTQHALYILGIFIFGVAAPWFGMQFFESSLSAQKPMFLLFYLVWSFFMAITITALYYQGQRRVFHLEQEIKLKSRSTPVFSDNVRLVSDEIFRNEILGAEERDPLQKGMGEDKKGRAFASSNVSPFDEDNEPNNAARKIGTAETSLMIGLNYIHYLVLEHVRAEGKINLPNNNSKELTREQIERFTLQANQDETIKMVNKAIRIYGLWLRSEFTKSNIHPFLVDVSVYGKSMMYFNDLADQLREALIEGKNGKSKVDALLQQFKKLTTMEKDDAYKKISAEVENFSKSNRLQQINPYFFKIAHYIPRFFVFSLGVPIVMYRNSGSVWTTFINAFPTAATITNVHVLAYLFIGVAAIAFFYSFFAYRAHMPNSRQFDRIRTPNSEISEKIVHKLTILGLLLGVIGVMILTPSLIVMMSSNLASLFPGWQTTSNLVSITFGGTLIIALLLEFISVSTNRVSVFSLSWRQHFGPSAGLGSFKTWGMYIGQFALFLALSWWMVDSVSLYYNSHLAGIGISEIKVPFLDVFSKMVFVFSKGEIQQFFMALFDAVGMGSIALILALAFIHSVFKMRVNVEKEHMGKLIDEKRREYYRGRRIAIIKFSVLTAALVVISWFFDYSRPFGGFMVGLGAFIIAITLANAAIQNVFIGVTSVAREAGRTRNIIAIFVLSAILKSVAWGLAWFSLFPGFAQLLAALSIMAFFGGLIVSAHPALSTPLILSAIAGYGMQSFESVVPYARIIFWLLFGFGVAARWIIRRQNRDEEQKLNQMKSIKDIPNGSFATGFVAGNTISAFHMDKSIEENLEEYMKVYDEYMVGRRPGKNTKHTRTSSATQLFDEHGQGMTRDQIKDVLKKLLEAEYSFQKKYGRKGNIFGEDQIVLNDKKGIQPQLEANGVPLHTVQELKEYNELIQALRIRRRILTLLAIANNHTHDTVVYLTQLAQAIKSSGMQKKHFFAIQSNSYREGGDAKERNDNDPKVQLLSQADQIMRTQLAKYIEITTGIRTEVLRDWTSTSNKALAQAIISPSMSQVKYLYIMDRNAQSFSLPDIVNDMRRFASNKNLLVVFPKRSTSNTLTDIGQISELGEFGFSMYEQTLLEDLGGKQGEVISIGWGIFIAMPVNEMAQRFQDPNFGYRFGLRAYDRKHPFFNKWVRYYGGIPVPPMFPHQSEDYVQAAYFAEAFRSLGRDPEVVSSYAFHYKLREHLRMVDMVKARPRWAGGGDPGQKGLDIYLQRVLELGSGSIFMKEMQNNRSLYYGLAVLSMINVLVTPFLIKTGHMPFAGVLLVLWVIGITFNQILRLNGLAAFIKKSGVWRGSAEWVFTQLRDMIGFAPLVFIEFYGVMNAAMKKLKFSYVFEVSGGAEDPFAYHSNPWEDTVKDVETNRLFNWITITGIAVTIMNVWAIMELNDLLNTLMLSTSLIFVYGFAIGTYITMNLKRPEWRGWLTGAKSGGIVYAAGAFLLVTIGAMNHLFPKDLLWVSHLILVFGISLLLFIIPGKSLVPSTSWFNALLESGYDKKANKWKPHRGVYQARIDILKETKKQMRRFLFLWGSAPVLLAYFVLFQNDRIVWDFSGIVLLGMLAVPLYKFISMMMKVQTMATEWNKIIHEATGRLKIIKENEQKIKEDPNFDKTKLKIEDPFRNINNDVVATVTLTKVQAFKEQFGFSKEWARRTALITAGILLFLLIVAAPAITKAQVVNYSLTLNYQKIMAFGIGILLVFAVFWVVGFFEKQVFFKMNYVKAVYLVRLYNKMQGTIVTNIKLSFIDKIFLNIWHWSNQAFPLLGLPKRDQYREIEAFIDALPESNRRNLTSRSLRHQVEGYIQGYWTPIDTPAPLMVADSLRNFRDAINKSPYEFKFEGNDIDLMYFSKLNSREEIIKVLSGQDIPLPALAASWFKNLTYQKKVAPWLEPLVSLMAGNLVYLLTQGTHILTWTLSPAFSLLSATIVSALFFWRAHAAFNPDHLTKKSVVSLSKWMVPVSLLAYASFYNVISWPLGLITLILFMVYHSMINQSAVPFVKVDPAEKLKKLLDGTVVDYKLNQDKATSVTDRLGNSFPNLETMNDETARNTFIASLFKIHFYLIQLFGKAPRDIDLSTLMGLIRNAYAFEAKTEGLKITKSSIIVIDETMSDNMISNLLNKINSDNDQQPANNPPVLLLPASETAHKRLINLSSSNKNAAQLIKSIPSQQSLSTLFNQREFDGTPQWELNLAELEKLIQKQQQTNLSNPDFITSKAVVLLQERLGNSSIFNNSAQILINETLGSVRLTANDLKNIAKLARLLRSQA